LSVGLDIEKYPVRVIHVATVGLLVAAEGHVAAQANSAKSSGCPQTPSVRKPSDYT